jgi:hypothetical protein
MRGAFAEGRRQFGDIGMSIVRRAHDEINTVFDDMSIFTSKI